MLNIKATSSEITVTANNLLQTEQIALSFYCREGECPFPKYEFLLSFYLSLCVYEAKVMKAFQT